MKKSLVSIIVPTRNSEATIEACLKSIEGQSYKDIEVIVIDNNSADKTKKIVNDLRLRIKDLRISLYNKGPERSAQRNFGASKAKGEYLLFIDSDMELSKTVVADCVRLAEGYKVHKALGGIIIPEESFGKGFWARCKALERSFYLGVDWIEAPRFFPRSVFVELKGFDEKLISGEDWDISQKIKEGYKILRIKSFINHDEGNLSLMKLLSKKMYYGAKLKNYSSKKENSNDFKSQSSIIKRYELFFAHPFKLFKNPVVGIGMLFMKTSEFAVLGLGYIFKK
jgi:glycosyltransferase involved in cell wall biosynthesis